MAVLPRIFLPASAPGDWQRLLGDPERHWRPGYSAWATAHCWQRADGFPRSVAEALQRSGEPWSGAEFLLGIPEYKVPLPPASGRPSQTDLFVVARTGDGLGVIAVEAKVVEPFGGTVEEWLGDKPSDGKKERLGFLLEQLGLDRDSANGLRYQLLHRTASALIEAKRFTARHALMLVHSFSQEDVGLSDFRAFAGALGGEAQAEAVTRVGERAGVELHLGWVRGEPQYLIDRDDLTRINELSEQERLLVTLVVFEEQSIEDAADALGIKPAEANAIYARAVTQLSARGPAS